MVYLVPMDRRPTRASSQVAIASSPIPRASSSLDGSQTTSYLSARPTYQKTAVPPIATAAPSPTRNNNNLKRQVNLPPGLRRFAFVHKLFSPTVYPAFYHLRDYRRQEDTQLTFIQGPAQDGRQIGLGQGDGRRPCYRPGPISNEKRPLMGKSEAVIALFIISPPGQ